MRFDKPGTIQRMATAYVSRVDREEGELVGRAVIGASGARRRGVEAFGHAYFDSPAQFLARHLQAALKVRVRFDKPGTIQRMATAYVSRVDREEAELVGREAVRLGSEGVSGVMVTLERAREPGYR